MSFKFESSLPKPITGDCSKVTSFQADIDTIKRYLTDIGNTYLLVAYRIYEMKKNESFKPLYKNIADACESCLGFKKSTTYNMIRIVETFGSPDEHNPDRISYSSLFSASSFSYSQLCEMLSLSSSKRLEVTPDMSVKSIRSLKKADSVPDLVVNSSSDYVPPADPVIVDVPPEDIIDSSDLFSQFSFQTSGTDLTCHNLESLPDDFEQYDEYDFYCSNCNLFVENDSSVYDSQNRRTFLGVCQFLFCPRCGARVTNHPLFNKE